MLIGPGRLRGFSFNTGREKKVKKKKERLARLRGFLFNNRREKKVKKKKEILAQLRGFLFANRLAIMMMRTSWIMIKIKVKTWKHLGA